MRNVTIANSRLKAWSLPLLLGIGLAACGDSDFLPGNGNNDQAGENRQFNTLNQLVIADCNSSPENTRPVPIDGLAFTNATPENTRPEDSAEDQACI